MRLVVLLGLCAFCALAAPSRSSSGDRLKHAVVRKGGAREGLWVDQSTFDRTGVAWAVFEDTLNVTGWGVLDVETNPAFSNEDQAHAAGMLEGFLTAEHIYTSTVNLAEAIFHQPWMPKPVKAFLDKQDAWARAQVQAKRDTDPFYAQLGFLLHQYDGLVDGYALRTPEVPFLGGWAFQMLNGVGDLFDIIPTVNASLRTDWSSLGRGEAEWLHAKSGHCSALVKVLGDFGDLLMGHSSWYTFANTNRIMKHYALNFDDPSTAARRVSFSSYAGFLESLDDFYMLSSGLIWTQTSNPMLDHSVYKHVKPESLLAWQRVRVASAMAHSGQEWFALFRTEFSGTYANQYVVVDLNLFEPGQLLRNGTLWVVEEMPGLIMGADQTETLRRGYWPSYNVPFYREMFVRSGYEAMRERHNSTFWTYELCPRAKIFRRDSGAVSSLAGLKDILRSNRYKDDPYAFDGERQNPMYAICSRGDLAETNKEPIGCYDTKVTSVSLGARDLRADIINGPTAKRSGGGGLAPFQWADGFQSTRHLGLPTKYEFGFVRTEPKSFAEMAALVQARPEAAAEDSLQVAVE